MGIIALAIEQTLTYQGGVKEAYNRGFNSGSDAGFAKGYAARIAEDRKDAPQVAKPENPRIRAKKGGK
jgi:hypothetical protein